MYFAIELIYKYKYVNIFIEAEKYLIRCKRVLARALLLWAAMVLVDLSRSWSAVFVNTEQRQNQLVKLRIF